LKHRQFRLAAQKVPSTGQEIPMRTRYDREGNRPQLQRHGSVQTNKKSGQRHSFQSPNPLPLAKKSTDPEAAVGFWRKRPKTAVEQTQHRFLIIQGEDMSLLKFQGRRLQKLSVAALLTTALAAPVGAQTVTAVMYSGVRLLDPVASSGYITQDHAYMVYDTLLALDAQQKIQPQMVEKWEVSADSKTYKFILRPGLKWHDGAPVKAEDCIASIKRWAEPDKLGQVLMSMVSEMKALDDRTFQIVLKEPTPLLLDGLSKPRGTPYMMPKRIAETPSNQPIKEHIGSGPFKFVVSEFKPGLQIVYEKNKDYVPRSEPASWMAGGKVVNVDKVVWITMPDSVTTANALMNGEIDYMELVPYDLLPMVENKPGIKVDVLDPVGQLTFYRFNHLIPPFNNKTLRLAAMASVDSKDVMQAMVGNPKYYKLCGSIYGCGGSPFENAAGAELLKPNLEKAKKLLKEGNYDGTPIVHLQVTDVSALSSQPMVTAAGFRKAGFKVNLQGMDFQTYATRRVNQGATDKGGWNAFNTNLGTLDISEPIRSMPAASNAQKAWFGWPDVPKIEELRQKFARTIDLAEQKKLAEQIQKLAIEEGVMVPIGQFYLPSAYRTSLTNIVKAPVPLFWGIKKTSEK
jgi:peptide/nickel transport system substrate-binding protein